MTATSAALDVVAADAAPKIGRSSWVDRAIPAAALTVLITSLLIVVRVPADLGSTLPPSIGKLLADTDKVWALLVWLCAGIAAVSSLALDRRARTHGSGIVARSVTSTLAVVGTLLALVLICWQDPLFEPLPRSFVGFSRYWVAAALLLSPVVFAAIWSSRFTPRRMLVVTTVGVGLAALLPLIQTPYSYLTFYDNSFTLDEMLAPASGRFPGFDYINQYASLLGFPLVVVATVLPNWFASSPESFAIGWMIVLQLATLAAGCAAVMRVTPRAIRWVVPLVVVPIAYIPSDTGLPYYADLPLRFVLPTALLLVIVIARMRTLGRPPSLWIPLLSGFVAGMAAFNNLDFGIPAGLAGVLALALAHGVRSAVTTVGLYVAGAVGFVLLYLGIGTLAGRTYQPDYTLFFVQSFGVDNFFNVDMTAFGLHSGMVFLGIVGVVVGVLGMRRLRGRNAILHQAIFFQAAWLLLSLVYFSGRSLTPTLVTGYFFPAAVLLGLLFVMGSQHLRLLRRIGWRRWTLQDWLSVALVLLTVALPIASIPALPNPLREGYRILVPRTSTSEVAPFLRPDPTAALAEVPKGDRIIGLISVAGTIWSLRLGITNANVYLHPDYLSFAGAATRECVYLSTLPGDVLVTNASSVHHLLGSPTCTDQLDLSHPTVLGTDPYSGEQWLMVARIHRADE